jgi:hypothetical protein
MVQTYSIVLVDNIKTKLKATLHGFGEINIEKPENLMDLVKYSFKLFMQVL